MRFGITLYIRKEKALSLYSFFLIFFFWFTNSSHIGFPKLWCLSFEIWKATRLPLGSSFLPWGLEIASKRHSEAFIGLTLFVSLSQGSQASVVCCSMSGNSCCKHFVQFSVYIEKAMPVAVNLPWAYAEFLSVILILALLLYFIMISMTYDLEKLIICLWVFHISSFMKNLSNILLNYWFVFLRCKNSYIV